MTAEFLALIAEHQRIAANKCFIPPELPSLEPSQTAFHCSDNGTWRITAFGRTQNLSEWARETGITRESITYRIRKLKWDVERALKTPARKMKVDY